MNILEPKSMVNRIAALFGRGTGGIATDMLLIGNARQGEAVSSPSSRQIRSGLWLAAEPSGYIALTSAWSWQGS